jgi:hypothetical protein
VASETANPPGAEVFISYAQDEDHAAALALADRVEGVGATVWIAERSIDGAQNYADEIVAAIDACKVVVALCSRASLQSRHVAVELSLAFEAGRPRLPLMLDPTPLPGQVRYWLADANRIDISGPPDQWFPRVLRALQRLGVSCGTADEIAWPEEDDDDVTTIAVPRDESPPSPRVAASDGPTVVPPPRSPGREAVTRTDGYRTPGTPRGYFRTPGDIHVHIDGGRNVEEILDLLHELGEPDDDTGCPAFPAKFNRISRFAGGPQRDDKAFAETYRHHTPGSVQKEDFGSFSTIWLGNDADLDASAVPALRKILDTIAEQRGAVVELERVIAVLDTTGQWEEADPPRVADPRMLEASELRAFPRLTTSTIEIHHSVDLPKRGASPVLSVDELPTWPHLGGWFLFDKGDFWSYRSSEFVGRTGEYHYAAAMGQKRLSDHLEASGHEYEMRTLVEQVLGIWRGGIHPRDDRHSIPALGEWELSCPPGGHVWVIAANFYGDRSPDVKRAMLENLGEDVVYTYFLRTNADMLRLGLLAEELERALVADGFTGDRARRTVGENVRCVLLSPDLDVQDDRLRRLLQSDYFLCPFDHEMGGYRLESSGLSGERVDDDDMRYLCDALTPLLQPRVRGLAFSAEESWAPRSSNQTVVCTDLAESAVDQGEQPWLKMLAAYDRLVAREVSTYGKDCLVVRPVRNGYLLIFAQASEAVEWARRLQFEVHRYNEMVAGGTERTLPIPTQNIALGYGFVSRILRAHGYDYIGGAIDDCIDNVARLREGVVAMSRSFAGQYENQVGKREFLASTREHPEPGLEDLTLLDWS